MYYRHPNNGRFTAADLRLSNVEKAVSGVFFGTDAIAPVPATSLALATEVPVLNVAIPNASSLVLSTAAPSRFGLNIIPALGLVLGEGAIVHGSYIVDFDVIGYASDWLDSANNISIAERFAATDSLTSRSSLASVTNDSVDANELLASIVFGQVTDALEAVETAGFIATAAPLVDNVVSNDLLTGLLRASAAATGPLAVTDELDGQRTFSSTDAVVVSDELTSSVRIYSGLTDRAVFSDFASASFTIYADLSDSGVTSDTVSGSLSLVGVLSDVTIAGDSLYESSQTVLVVNADTGAVSSYVFTPTVVGMADYQGVLYLVGPDGLYALDAVQDDDGAVVWSFRTGFSNLGTDKLKRVNDANFQARIEGDTTFQVVSDRYGNKQEWNYRLPPLTRNNYRDGMVKVGKGINSVYWQFAARGVGPAEIDQLRLTVEPLSRRR